MSTARNFVDDQWIITLPIVTAGSAVRGYGAIFSGTDATVTIATANTSACIGVFMDTSSTAGAMVRIAFGGIVPVLASGTCTAGGPAQVTATGFEDAGTWASGGGNVDYLYGTFMQTGTSGDMIGLAFSRGGTLEHS